MTLGWIIAGSWAELMLGGWLLMGTVFSVAGIANGAELGRVESAILTLSMGVLPALPLLSAGMVVYRYVHGGSASSYGWYAVPLAPAVLYVAYATRLSRRPRVY